MRHVLRTNARVTIDVTDRIMAFRGGYLQDREQLEFNSIPTALNLNLSYLGLFSLETQSLRYRFGLAPKPIRLQQLLALTPGVAHPQPGQTYRLSVRWRRGVTDETCSAGRRLHRASRLQEALPGHLLNLRCTISRNGIVRARDRVGFLTAYGLYLILERKTAAFTARGRIVSIKRI